MRKIRPLRTRRGLSLLELSISLAIASALVILTMRKVSSDLQTMHLKKESNWVVGVLADIQEELEGSSNYAGLSDLTMGRLKSVPSAFLDKSTVGVTTVINGFSGRVHVGPLNLGGVNNGYALTYTGVSLDACANLIAMFYSDARTVAPLYGIVGSKGAVTSIPTIGLNGDSIDVTGHVVLKNPLDVDFDMAVVGDFCVRSDATDDGQRSVTLVRRRNN